GWKEIIAVAGLGATIVNASVPERDRSDQLSNYPVDLLDSPPQDRQARVVFQRETAPPVAARSPGTPPKPIESTPRAEAPQPAAEAPSPPPSPAADSSELRLRPNRQATPRSALTDLVTVNDLGLGV